jgi:hypothetical protein
VTAIRPSSRTKPSSTTASWANSRCTSIPIQRTTRHTPFLDRAKGNRWDGTTPTDTRSRRSRTSRRGGQLLTQAHSPPNKNGLPKRVPRRPLFRTVTPYARPKTPSQPNNTRTLASFHTGYQRDRVTECPLPPRRVRGHFPNEQAALKCLYLTTRSLDPNGSGKARWATRWKPALNAFTITFPGRIPTR